MSDNKKECENEEIKRLKEEVTNLRVKLKQRDRQIEQLLIRQGHSANAKHLELKPCNLSKIQPFLPKITEWNFDMFKFAELTNGRPLFYSGNMLFRQTKLTERFNINETQLNNFLNTIEFGYKPENPYHNNTHAADVAQTASFFYVNGGLGKYLTDLDLLAYLVAAMIHDYDHPGYNNAFIIHTNDPIAITHNDASVLENHHLCSAFNVLLRDDNNILSGLSDEDYRYVRKTIINLVIATDFGLHFSILQEFKSSKPENGWSKDDAAHRLMLMKIALKCADISHTSKSSQLHFNWTERITREFHKQGDEEISMGRKPSGPAQDRTIPVPKSQAGFIKFLVNPLFEAWVDVCEESTLVLKQLQANYAHWVAKSELQEEGK